MKLCIPSLVEEKHQKIMKSSVKEIIHHRKTDIRAIINSCHESDCYLTASSLVNVKAERTLEDAGADKRNMRRCGADSHMWSMSSLFPIGALLTSRASRLHVDHSSPLRWRRKMALTSVCD